jgi:pyruvate formate lyase activating enzyme
MARCSLCSKSSQLISRALGVCLKCIRNQPEPALSVALRAHKQCRSAEGLPITPPKDPHGKTCQLCVNECSIPESGFGYCGLRKNQGGKIIGVSRQRGKLSWYHDRLPTNCVGDWVCPAGTGAGYPRYAYCRGAEYGYKNLAVFFHACTFNCLFCQNWHFKRETLKASTVSVQRLAADVDPYTACICYFGGDPSPQLPFSLKASRLAIDSDPDRILRICWETNGSMASYLMDQMMDMALESGGCVKFDLKAHDENLHRALTGVTNRRTLDNFNRAAERFDWRPIPPPLIASTLLVPGYIDAQEIRAIADLIATANPDIPYSLLAFHPQYHMSDLPLTPRQQAHECLAAAKAAGLTRVRLGNAHILV